MHPNVGVATRDVIKGTCELSMRQYGEPSLASHTPQSRRKRGLVTLRMASRSSGMQLSCHSCTRLRNTNNRKPARGMYSV